MKTNAIAIVCAASLLTGCLEGSSSATFNAPPSSGPTETPVTPTDDGTTDPVENASCQMGKVYTGFGGRVLVAGRVEDQQNYDRLRIKPFSALSGEFTRVMGQAPALLSQMGGTFSQPPARWFEEPQASAVTVYSTYRVGFVGCLELTASGDAYAAMPVSESAMQICTDWARKFWSRTPAQSEVDTCVRVAMQDTVKETNPRRRWAYTCASLISSVGFLSY